MTREWTRPTDNFWISSLSSVIAIEHAHRTAGFSPVEEAVVRRHYLQFLTFLRENGLTVKLASDESVKDPELRNHDLTDLGFAFVQGYHDRWIERMYKLRTPEEEERHLQRWLAKVQAQ